MKNFLYEEIFDESETANAQPATEETADAFVENFFDERAKISPTLDPRGINPSAPVTKTANEWDQPLTKSLKDLKGTGVRTEKKVNAATGETWVTEFDSAGAMICGYVE